MWPRENEEFYTEEELVIIKENWLNDKKRIDADLAYEYDIDKYREYSKYLDNRNLRLLFKHASYLYWKFMEDRGLILYPGEEKRIINSFRRIIENGYYDRSKEEEKRVRIHLANIIRRQTYRRYKK